MEQNALYHLLPLPIAPYAAVSTGDAHSVSAALLGLIRIAEDIPWWSRGGDRACEKEDKQGQLSEWVTLRACSVLKAVYG